MENITKSVTGVCVTGSCAAQLHTKSIFPGNQLLLRQAEIQTDQPKVTLDTSEGEAINTELFLWLCFKSRKLYKDPHPRMNNKSTYPKHTSNQPSWLCIYTKSSREKGIRYLQGSSSQAEISGCSSSIPQRLRMQFYGKLATPYLLERTCNYLD